MAATVRAKFDLTIIGGGIVGLAVARETLLRHPKLRICVLEKDKELANHQSRRNSGVVHAGIYYKKGTLKSKFCIKGAEKMKQYCLARGLPYKQCGKMIVATNKNQLEGLSNLFKNASANNIKDIEMINSSQIQSIQPGCTEAIEAIWSPNTAIVDWRQVALSFARDFEENGGTVMKEFSAYKFESNDKDGTVLVKDFSSGTYVETKSMVTCGGAYSDFLARQTGNSEHPKVVPFKGNYFILSDNLASSIKTNIYPVPDPKLPFLGVHITPRIDGSVLVGPTSLLTFGYERYSSDTLPKPVELYHILYRSGLVRMLRKKDYFKAGLIELMKYFSPSVVVREASRLLPDIRSEDLIDTDFCGIRAQALTKDGDLVDDFLFETGLRPQFQKVLHLRNCPSPAATSSLSIAERVANTLEERFI